MFWRFGGYANVSTIDTILERDNFQLEELLDESDLVEELKHHNAKLVEYLRGPEVLETLLQYVVAPKLEPVAAPDDDDEEDDEDEKPKGVSRASLGSSIADETSRDDKEKKRNRYAFVSTEILSSDTWSMYDALMECKGLLRDFWQFLKRDAPLDPLQASYFTKVNEALFDKKTEEMISLLKSLEGAVQDILKHVDCPMIMDLLLKIISLERTESGQGIVEWLYTQNVMTTLVSFLGPEHSWSTQTSAADFIKAIITISANASQNEQTCIGPNELTRQLVSRPCVEQLIKFMLGGGNPLTCGVGIVIEVIRKNNSDYDPEGVDINSPPTSRDPIYLGTLLRLFADHVPDFMSLIMNAPAKNKTLSSTFGGCIEPLGFDRFKTCELMAELLHCSNMLLLNEAGAEDLIMARDAQRHRLRAEGRLLPLGGNELSVEDISINASQLSTADQGRKLEVTNVSADDDGFEEVSHAADEDNSHGVLELPDAPAPPRDTPGIDKDDAEFVDEPLSSPTAYKKPEPQDDKPTTAHAFEEPDLVVAPLSPSTKLATLAGTGTEARQQSASEQPLTETVSAPEEQWKDDLKGEPKEQPGQALPDTKDKEISPREQAVPPVSPAEPASTEQQATTSANAEQLPTEPKDTTFPQREDVPAPLFSQEEAPAPETTPEPTQAGTRPKPESTTAEPGDAPTAAPVLASEPPQTDPTGTQPTHVTPPESTPGDEKSSGVAEDAPPSSQPVVGDYLKMQFVKHGVVPTILSFFFQYPWNNFLHNVVYDVVQQVFNGPMDRGYNPTLAVSLFTAADITNQIINGQRESEKSQAERNTRMGYMGHLTLIAEEVVKFTERHPPEMLSEVVLEKVMAQDWVSYVEGPLAETRERDNAILGGVRPEVAMSRANAQSLMGDGFSGLSSIGLGGGASTALAEAGLNGGSDLSDNANNSGIGPFALSAGTLMSGFGSSSDEDDDEDQDTEEDVNNEVECLNRIVIYDPDEEPDYYFLQEDAGDEPFFHGPIPRRPSSARLRGAFVNWKDRFRAYTDPLNANSNMSPPSIPPPPPPPPPLNVPPSRARLQLAARLAMNKRNAAAAAAAANSSQEESTQSNADNAAESVGSTLPSTVCSERLRNPFADYDDGDEDGSSSSSDEDVGENVGSDSLGTGSSNTWNRGSWWREVVRSARGGRRGFGRDDTEEAEVERFGDGRDDDSSDEEGGRRLGDEDDIEDEEFGDFAMPEVEERVGAASSGIDTARESILVKPMPLHPGSSVLKNASISPFSSLWPFSREKKDDETTPSSGGEVSSSPASLPAATGSSSGAGCSSAVGISGITEEPVELTHEEEAMLSEDGKLVNRAVEATRRSSIEDPDEEEVGEEIIVHRGAGVP
ncbi:hypothetical protein VTJ49DRAFT_7380 [Mycothermus thermophilus]|uniref:Extragenic suppressor of kinetochore protein 1 n=1 Tax=Humicola insolens TaxID=85995 RepID=A0ABR3VH19_HUMIN